MTDRPEPSGAEQRSGESASPGADSGNTGGSSTTSPDAGRSRNQPDGASAPRAGEATRRQEWLNEAEQVLIEGDLVGGDKYVISFGPKERPVRTSPLSPSLLELVEHAFVEPSSWPTLLAGFAVSRIGVLRAPAGHGRMTLAVRLLFDLQQDPLYLLDPDVDLRRLADALDSDERPGGARFNGAGFLLARDGIETPVSGRELDNLNRALAAADARLIIITGPDVRLADAEALDYCLPPFEPLPHTKILAAHLRLLRGPQAADLLAQPGMPEIINASLTPELPRKRAADFAIFIDRSVKDGKVDLAGFRGLVNRRETDDFTIWLDGLTDRDDRCFVIALAVLDGLPYEDVAAAGRMLASQLTIKSQVRSSDDRPGPREKLNAFRARERDIYARGLFGRAIVTAVEFTERTHPRRIIEHFWERSLFAKELLDWLLEMAADEEQQERIRIRAATAVGLFAVKNFVHLHQRVFLPWSRDEQPLRREAVVNALRVVAREPVTRRNVADLVDEWHGQRPTPLCQATAARIYGVSLANSDPEWLIDRLGRLAVAADEDITLAIGRSVADLVGHGDCRLAAPVLRALVSWLPNYRRERAAQVAFLSTAMSLMTETWDDPSDEAPEVWPTLLVLADQDEEQRVWLSALWANVLQGELFHEQARKVMTDWAVMAEKVPPMRQAFTYLLGAIAVEGTRADDVVRHLVRDWGSPDHLYPLPATVAVASTYLDQMRPTARSEEQS